MEDYYEGKSDVQSRKTEKTETPESVSGHLHFYHHGIIRKRPRTVYRIRFDI